MAHARTRGYALVALGSIDILEFTRLIQQFGGWQIFWKFDDFALKSCPRNSGITANRLWPIAGGSRFLEQNGNKIWLANKGICVVCES